MIAKIFNAILGRRQFGSNICRRQPKLLLTPACVAELTRSMARPRAMGHEGIVYLLGLTDGWSTLGAVAMCPEAQLTRGSFEVGPVAMASIVRTAAGLGLQVVGQVHTHPAGAFHTQGDMEGARIRFDGYTSMVLPNLGEELPSLRGSRSYQFRFDLGWRDISEHHTFVLPERVQ